MKRRSILTKNNDEVIELLCHHGLDIVSDMVELASEGAVATNYFAIADIGKVCLRLYSKDHCKKFLEREVAALRHFRQHGMPVPILIKGTENAFIGETASERLHRL